MIHEGVGAREITATKAEHHAINAPQRYDDGKGEIITCTVAVIRVD